VTELVTELVPVSVSVPVHIESTGAAGTQAGAGTRVEARQIRRGRTRPSAHDPRRTLAGPGPGTSETEMGAVLGKMVVGGTADADAGDVAAQVENRASATALLARVAATVAEAVGGET
jgi:hypothetical protein